MTKDQALKLALEALQHEEDTGNDDAYKLERDAIKEALAQLEQDGKCKYCTDGCPACDARKLLEQKPVAWGMEQSDGEILDVITPEEHARLEGGYTVPLYRHPQRTWVGLTDEEILDNCESVPDYDIGNHDLIQFARAIEAKLKEKNT